MSTPATVTNKRGHEGQEDEPSCAKKSRQEDGPESQQDEEFWEEDGVVVLVARNVRFRVYRGILAHHSPVFADMFSLPQPTESGSACACPEVHLDDSPQDLRYLLRALLPKKHTRFITPVLTYHAISAYIRLGHKYQIEHIVTESLDFLKSHFTSDFFRWNAQSRADLLVPSGRQWEPVHAIGVVNLARLVDCPSIIPTALIVCCTLKPQDLLHGFKREDGTDERLDEGDLARCIEARAELGWQGLSIVLRASSATGSRGFRNYGCTDTGDDSENCKAALASSHEDVYSQRSGFDRLFARSLIPFQDWSTWVKDMSTMNCLCTSCADELADRVCKEQQVVWKQLPQLLGVRVDGW